MWCRCKLVALAAFKLLLLVAPAIGDEEPCPSRPQITQTGKNGWREFQNIVRSCPDGGGCPFPGVPLDCWDTSRVTNMAYAFRGHGGSPPVGSWDTSSVTSMYGMFLDAREFDQPIGAWNTSRVASFSHMFDGALAFNQPLAAWDVSAATDLSVMFLHAPSFDQCLASWASKFGDACLGSPSSQYRRGCAWYMYGWNRSYRRSGCPIMTTMGRAELAGPDLENGPWCQRPEDGCVA